MKTNALFVRVQIAFSLFAVSPLFAQQQELLLNDALAIPSPPGYLETIGNPDPIEYAMVLGTWKPPVAGDLVKYNDTMSVHWALIHADAHGWFGDSVLESAYVSMSIDLPQERTFLLAAMGNNMVYVNGVPRSGNPYGYKDEWETWETRFDYSLLPVTLHKGKNNLLFHCSRGGTLKARLLPVDKPLLLNTRDVTLPDLFVNEPHDTWGAVVVINASASPAKGVTLRCSQEGAGTPVPEIPPFSVRKVGFRLVGASPDVVGPHGITLRLESAQQSLLDSASIQLRVVKRTDTYKVTFRSRIDGSVQYFAIAPARDTNNTRPLALFFSLHGAGVEALNQANAYSQKSWGVIVAPTNRRPFGYNWEDWGRVDALEVLDHAKRLYRIDESRVYLTGHSMGGHGVYHLGSLFPDKFAAIGPSAGWISFWTYRVRESFAQPSLMRSMLMRATLPSDTYTMAHNYGHLGVYILHGSQDDNVAPQQSMMMAEHLKGFHRDFIFHLEPGVGHWWDKSDEPGADCVDWAPLFDFFAQHARPGTERTREISFASGNPGISSRCAWVGIEAQLKQLELSKVDLHLDPLKHRISGRTHNVQRLSLDLATLTPGSPVTVELDSQNVENIPWPREGATLWLEQHDTTWSAAGPPDPSRKGPHRYGPLKEMIGNNVLFVYGTRGSQEENRWAFEKARYDAERFWYQANGGIEVVADSAFAAAAELDRNVVLYGNARTNGAWRPLLNASPVQVYPGGITLGEKKFSGEDLCCLFIRPRPGSPTASVGVISGTGIVGMRLTNRQSYLMPGIGFPDCMIMQADALVQGERGILAAGYFGTDWGVATGEWVLQEKGKR